MTLSAGTRFGPYEIQSLLGAGGMGEVYRARDTKLNREVAIKVLLAAVANDPERMARFSREAQLLASLNHPHIAQIHGLEDVGDVRALVMELFAIPGSLTRRSYAAAGDGRRFLVTRPLDAATARPITIVLNWQASLKR